MSRLIDADVLKAIYDPSSYEGHDPNENWDNVISTFEEIRTDIDDQPTVDAVPVVRCKDCKYAYMTDDGYCNWCDIMADLLGLEYDDIHLPGDWFCADGKKVMDNEQTN